METNMNNVVVKHRDHTISIAQHKNSEGKNVQQEILVWGPNVNDEIIPFGSNGPWLVAAIQEAIGIIDDAMENV
jgi:hypothetical protein